MFPFLEHKKRAKLANLYLGYRQRLYYCLLAGWGILESAVWGRSWGYPTTDGSGNAHKGVVKEKFTKIFWKNGIHGSQKGYLIRYISKGR